MMTVEVQAVVAAERRGWRRAGAKRRSAAVGEGRANIVARE
jgi:hypothetical protein